MSKDLQAIKYLNDTCINFLDRTKELYCTVTFTRKRAEILRDNIAEVEQALLRLEAIDNSNPSEALENLNYLKNLTKVKDVLNVPCWNESYEIVEKALLKAQEPKQYLKWEDLEFNPPKMIDVKMSGNKYKLELGCNIAGYNLAILRNNKQQYYFLEADKQFFNDLRLERVEE